MEESHHRLVSGFDLLHIPYDERWEHLKPIIVEAYLGKNGSGKPLTIPKLAEFIKKNHGFSAEVHQYRHRLHKWDIRKRTTTQEKDDIVAVVGKRSRAGASTSAVTIHQGGLMKEVDKKQLKRQADHPSPFGPITTTPRYLNVGSPEATTPGGPAPDLTPTAALITQKTLQDRSNLLLQGRREELLSRCNESDRRIISGWLHDYWMHSYLTAKFWGRGPQQWTAGLVSEVTLVGNNLETPPNFSSPAGWFPAPSPRTSEIPQPTSLCRWVIHYEEDSDLEYETEDSSPIETQAEFELRDESSWTPWPAAETQNRTLQSAMEESFTRSQFSATSVDELPLSNEFIAQAVSKSPKELALDSLAFAIMSGNLESVSNLLESGCGIDIGTIHPYHLAASILDGGHTCCKVMNDLIRLLDDHPIALNNIDSDGHTVLDSLLISILRSHTNLAPFEVSTSFNHRTRFPGEERDICGRWDADSPTVRRLHKEGHARIPQQWKHNFCHSSVQAVCHSMLSIYVPSSAPKIDTLSGLFRRRCTECGLELKLGPLHVLVIVAFYLAQRGMDGETLFGAVACAVCLLVLGADANLKAELSVAELLNSAEDNGCRHHPITAAGLAEQVPQSMIDTWSPSCQTGWKCLSLVLHRSTALYPQRPGLRREQQSTMVNSGLQSYYDNGRYNFDLEFMTSEGWEEVSDGDLFDCELVDDHEHFELPCMQDLGVLWASIQTELLTWRKITSLDPDISENFQMVFLERWLKGETEGFQTPLVEDRLMREHSKCGWFGNILVPTASGVSARYFMNMDVWVRTSFVDTMVPIGCKRY
ncbi:Putative Clr5 domain-containing protein [Colletotrichum destructivum]|uniref:Clr5 domain-containing protein n=1 Tax=Colletotrichum destructivum TaxID=34406 RepID=A0AAX4IF80_9PEZI|nr:Putative Clr5 domain-containing protein [Colletotrichum destructivum]